MTQPNDKRVKNTVHSTAHNGVDGDNATVVDDNVSGDGNSNSAIRNSDSNNDGAGHNLDAQLRRNISARYRQERRFRRAAASAILIGVAFLLWLITVSLLQAAGALWQTHIALDIDFKQAYFAPASDLSNDVTGNATSDFTSDAATADLTARIEQAPFARMIKESLRNDFPEVRTRKQKRELYRLVSSGAEFDLRDEVLQRRELIGQTARVWLLAGGDVDLVTKGVIDRNLPEDNRRVSDKMIAHIDALRAQGRIEKRFNTQFFTAGDSRNAEQAGILGALLGSILTLLVTMLLALPVGVCAAVYLQEFAPRNKWIDWVEVNINNLAAVPSITFGLLGLAVLINFVGLPRSVPLVGGMVVGVDDLADGDYLEPRGVGRGAAAHSPSRARRRRIQNAKRAASCCAAGVARDVDRRDYRVGASLGRNRAAVGNRHGRVHRRYSERLHRPIDRLAGADLPVGRQPGARLCRAHFAGDCRAIVRAWRD